MWCIGQICVCSLEILTALTYLYKTSILVVYVTEPAEPLSHVQSPQTQDVN